MPTKARLVPDRYPSVAQYGRLDPDGPGPVHAEDFESWDQDDDTPVELIRGWVLPMTPTAFDASDIWRDLIVILDPLARKRAWKVFIDARHRLPSPRNTVVFPDIAVHAAADVTLVPGTKTVSRVPDLAIEILGEKSFERDVAPYGAKFLAYQASGIREYYYTWPDGRDASGFVLRKGVYVPLPHAADGFFKSPLLKRSLRLVEAAIR